MRRSQLSRLVLAVSPGILLTYSLFRNSWDWALFPTMSPRFADLRMITRTADCVSAGNWSMESETCDLWNRAYNYPPVWAELFSLLRLGNNQTSLIGFLLGLLVIATFAFMALRVARENVGLLSLVAVSAASVSPPIAILIERGNTESVILLLTLLAALLSVKSRLGAIVVAAMAAGLKIFPILVGLHYFRTRRNWWEPTFFTVLALVLMVPAVRSIDLITERTPYTSEYSFGASVTMAVFWPEVLEAERYLLLPVNLGATLALGSAVFWILKSEIRSAVAKLQAEPFVSSQFTLCALVFLGTYLSGTRFDYSLCFLVPIVVSIALSRSTNFVMICTQGLIFVSMWGSHFGRAIPNERNPIADLAATGVAAVLVAIQIANFFDRRPVGDPCRL